MDTYEGSFEQCVFESLWRAQVLRSTDDIAVGKPWSVAFNSSEFLDSLQRIHGSKWENSSIWPYWAFCHVGGDKPN